ncbi:SLIT and NTRK-like protein 6 [Clupea harengus]|uniref:SLIT and NTRK-like protein 6 n=1 Tax=Clupea harengus TaxID=7950 RepID=A0A6P8FU82_CLUHA|nr:SLIT and NTRK-like protein 6 [Clupea harengus]
MLLCLCFILMLLWSFPRARLVIASACPIGCCCSQPGALVLCEFLGLRSLPHSVPLNTSVLSMAHNLLCNMDHLLQPFFGLQELSLSHNQLDHFPRGLPPSLESLQLRENLITYITTGALRQLGNLIRLDLEENRIRAIQPGALLGLSRLKMLIVRGNRLSSLPLYMPPSLTHLDVSANCILALELPSLVRLVNLQIFKINSNCLQSVPEAAFDSLPRLYSVELANNLWVCECDIMYLYRWLQSGRLTTAGDLVCTAPLHLAHKMLVTLSITVICPGKQADEVTHGKSRSQGKATGVDSESPVKMTQALTELYPGSPQTPTKSGKLIRSEEITQDTRYHTDFSATHLLANSYSLGGLTYEDCLSLNKSKTAASTPSPERETSCLDQSTGPPPAALSSVAQPASTPSPAGESGLHSSPSAPRVYFHPRGMEVVTVLSILCVLTGLLLVGVSLLLKMALLHNQRVFPMQPS